MDDGVYSPLGDSSPSIIDFQAVDIPSVATETAFPFFSSNDTLFDSPDQPAPSSNPDFPAHVGTYDGSDLPAKLKKVLTTVSFRGSLFWFLIALTFFVFLVNIGWLTTAVCALVFLVSIITAFSFFVISSVKAISNRSRRN
eukprot:TRINITY_DN7288_c0_g1_i1.p2 TRINITY_DN7288_c0_g1~~TRINITY_DN7288_c0_g1_i1.p2  ORF type:complete len:141 (-),score=43.61 TRINITY_DN7288_c0_g1_i1:70-492(-)